MFGYLFFIFKKTIMKKSLIIAVLGLTTLLFAASCSKSGSAYSSPPPPPGGATPQGNWIGGHHNGFGGPVFYFALNLQAGGVLVVSDNSAITPDIANGTWTLVADSVRATYTYTGSSAIFSLAGKYTTTSNIMIGTIGSGTSTTGAGVFSVTKQ
jgi:hypothetical protein